MRDFFLVAVVTGLSQTWYAVIMVMIFPRVPTNLVYVHRPMGSEPDDFIRAVMLPTVRDIVPPGLKEVSVGISLLLRMRL